MIDETMANSVTISGRLVERPSFSETATGELLAHFWVRHGGNSVWCVCTGPVAENVKRFAHADVEVLAHGCLDWLSGENEQPHVKVDRLAFANPTELSDLLAVA